MNITKQNTPIKKPKRFNNEAFEIKNKNNNIKLVAKLIILIQAHPELVK